MKLKGTLNGITAEITLTKEQEKVFEKPRRTIWIMSAFGVIYSQLESKDPKDDLGCFRYMFAAYSEAECIENKKAADMKAEYKEWADKCNGRELNLKSDCKYSAVFDIRDPDGILVVNDYFFKGEATYFLKEEDICTFINRVGISDFIKYVLGVKE